MTNRHLVAATVVAAAAAATAWLPLPASADPPVATAWWHVLRQQTPVGAIPAAPVPDNGALPVQNGPAGVLAFSAVRYDVGAATSATLKLTYAAPAPPVSPGVRLCRPRTHWVDGADQEWGARPAYDCTASVTGSASAGAMTWQVGPSLIRDGTLDAVLVPDGADRTPYAVSFSAPDASSVVTSAAVAPVPPAPVPPPPGRAGGSSVQPAGPASGGSAPVPPAGAGAVSAPSAGSAPAVAASAGGGVAGAVAPVADARPPDNRTVGAALLAAAAVALLLRGLLGGRSVRPGRSLLGPDATTS